MTILRVLDIETTGEDPEMGAEIVELGWTDVRRTTSKDENDEPYFGGEILAPVTTSKLYHTHKPSPPEVLAVHHIQFWESAPNPMFGWGAAESDMSVINGRKPEYYVAHNADFERKFLHQFKLPWICTYKAALRVWPDAPRHSNQTLKYFLHLEDELDESLCHPPHRAGPDAYVTAAILTKLLEKASIEDLLQWTNEPRLLPKCPIGDKQGHKGKPWSEVDMGFLDWMVNKAPDMDADFKWNAQHELDRRRTLQLQG